MVPFSVKWKERKIYDEQTLVHSSLEFSVSSMTLGMSLNHSELTSTSVRWGDNDPCLPGLLEGQGTSFTEVL